MPYIKVISIRNSVTGCLKYIANPDKTEEQVYLSSLNCSEDISVAEQEFCLTYQHYSHKNFYAPTSDNGKSPVKAFHIIQSFKAGERAAETVHKIGLEWVKAQKRATAFYVNDYGFVAFEGFMKSRSEQLRQKNLQEEKHKTTAVKKTQQIRS